jgi:hypothetical protein
MAAGIELGDFGDGRNLAQQAQRIEPALLDRRARAPRRLRGPADLVLDLFDELLDLGCSRLRLLALDTHQRRLMLLIGEPDFQQTIGQKRNADHGHEQRHVFSKQPAADLALLRAHGSVRLSHSITPSARQRSGSSPPSPYP